MLQGWVKVNFLIVGAEIEGKREVGNGLELSH